MFKIIKNKEQMVAINLNKLVTINLSFQINYCILGVEQKQELLKRIGEEKFKQILDETDDDPHKITSIEFHLIHNFDGGKEIDIKEYFSLNWNNYENSNELKCLEEDIEAYKSLFLQDYLKKLLYPNSAQVIIPTWEALEKIIIKFHKNY